MNTIFTAELGEHDSSQGLRKLEAQYIKHVYEKSKYNQSKAARELGLSRGTLRSKLNSYFPGQYI